MTNNFWYLICSFTSGLALMSLEIVASRVMAPLIGNSIYTWTSIIGLVLLGLSIGAVLGGKIADKRNPDYLLIWGLGASALSVFLIIVLKNKTSWLLDNPPSILWLNISLAIYLFLLPSVLLGSLQPIILKKYSQNLDSLGYRYGLLSAAWSLGSILGVFITGFILISIAGTTTTLNLLSLLLLLLGLITAIKVGYKNAIVSFIVVAIIMAGSILLGASKSTPHIIYQKETDYYSAKVIDFNIDPYGQSRLLLLDLDTHSIETTNKIDQSYTEIYPAFGVFKKEIKDILIIGGGAYTLPKYLSNYYTDSKVSVIELDPEIKNIAEKYFNLDSSKITTIIGDARQIMNQSEQKYDLIYGDAYNSFISVPGHLLTTEFNSLIRGRLNPGGIYAINFIGAVDGQNSNLFKSIAQTFRQTFTNFYVFAFAPDIKSIQNITIVGLNDDKNLDTRTLISRLKLGPNSFLGDKLITSPDTYLDNEAIILTDNFYPTDRLMQHTIKNYLPNFLSFLNKIYNP